MGLFSKKAKLPSSSEQTTQATPDEDNAWMNDVPEDMLKQFMLQAAVHRAKTQSSEMSQAQVDELKHLTAACASSPPLKQVASSQKSVGLPLGVPLEAAVSSGTTPPRVSVNESALAQRIAAEKRADQEKYEKDEEERKTTEKKTATNEVSSIAETLVTSVGEQPGQKEEVVEMEEDQMFYEADGAPPPDNEVDEEAEERAAKERKVKEDLENRLAALEKKKSVQERSKPKNWQEAAEEQRLALENIQVDNNFSILPSHHLEATTESKKVTSAKKVSKVVELNKQSSSTPIHRKVSSTSPSTPKTTPNTPSNRKKNKSFNEDVKKSPSTPKTTPSTPSSRKKAKSFNEELSSKSSKPETPKSSTTKARSSSISSKPETPKSSTTKPRSSSISSKPETPKHSDETKTGTPKAPARRRSSSFGKTPAEKALAKAKKAQLVRQASAAKEAAEAMARAEGHAKVVAEEEAVAKKAQEDEEASS